MSRTSSYRSEIVIPQPQLRAMKGNIKGVPCMEIMQLALQRVARNREGSLCSDYLDCNQKSIPSLLGIKTKAFSSGVGIDVDPKGRVIFKYDRKAPGSSNAKGICDEITRTYATIAVMRAQKKYGYNIENVREETHTGNRKTVTITSVDT